MASAGLALTNVLLGLENIGAVIGFGVAEQNKIDELNKKADKLKNDLKTSSDLYDHVYFWVAVDLERIKKAIDKLPSDLLVKLQNEMNDALKDSEGEHAVKILGQVIGYTGGTAEVTSGILQIVRYKRNRRAQNEDPPEEPDPFEYVPLDGEEAPVSSRTSQFLLKNSKA